ncbi:chemotaxis protein CheW [Clostridium sp. UBA4548]|uniref:chemotaxis protein CheW n=1 Tax=Clostridium sp. UBA4548 TaxID=1946361 RepID=UPI0025BF3011|nr:chemotaxis protein CheW [Clostridium sp. UBA4548]
MQVVVFDIGNEQFAVETSKVQSINDLMEITKVPKAQNYIKGLINLRGNIITILDINLLLGMINTDARNDNIIILKLEEELVGITVDAVDEVIEFDEEKLEKIYNDMDKPYNKGIINLKERIITLIDFDKLLQ